MEKLVPSDHETERSPLILPSDLEGYQQEVPRPEDYVPTSLSSDLGREIWEECKKVLKLVAPVGFNRVSTYAFGVVTQAFAGRFGTVELAAVSLATGTIGGISFGLMGQTQVFLAYGCPAHTWGKLGPFARSNRSRI